MTELTARPVGLTQDTGFQIGARRTFPLPPEDAWRFLTSAEGVRLWLGDAPGFLPAKGARFQLEDGTSGEVTTFVAGSHLRMTFQPPGWPRASIVQIRVIAKGERCVVAFHQEHLPGPSERAQCSLHYATVLEALAQVMA
jgi:uncharacterized protein YndB with AHSA1/START domain